MTQKQFDDLRHRQLLTQRAFKPSKQVTSRRSAKNASKHVGKWVKGGRITHDVSLERIFNHPSWR